MAQKAILVEEDRGRYDIALGAKPVDWPLVKSRAEQVQEVEPLTGWGQWKKVYRVDGATYFVEETMSKELDKIEIHVSFTWLQDVTGASMDDLERAEAMLDELINEALDEELGDEAEDVSASVGSFDGIEAWDRDGDPINPDGEIAQRVSTVLHDLSAGGDLLSTIQHARDIS